MLALVLAVTLNVTSLEVFKPAPRAAAEVLRRVPAGVPLAVCDFEEPSLLFYLGPGRGPVQIIQGGGALLHWSNLATPGACIATRKNVSEAELRRGGPLTVAILGSFPGYNYSNGKVVELLILGRALP